MLRIARALALISISFSVTGCVFLIPDRIHYVLEPLEQGAPPECAPSATGGRPETILGLALSGGGSRAAVFGAAAEIRENEIAFTVKHRGKALDDRPMEDPAFDGSRDNGFGLFIIENYMDRIERFEDAAGNKCTRMVKKLGNS